ncbi:hypothetical protein [Acinetobacter sp. CFCC 10889]|uniref:hypothetical protein n=1 Tax=Acinetobacter sp. CFCC 10889 TaxID=1775557 RepID=UPI000DD06C63|nr:hypothetical protein [Acinetobacter sp. CFCC 10889]
MTPQEIHVTNSLSGEPIELVANVISVLPKIIDAVNQSNWIDVGFLLPPYDTKVLVSLGDDCDPEFDYLTTDADENEVFANYGSDVKHWMYMPKLPHVEQ